MLLGKGEGFDRLCLKCERWGLHNIFSLLNVFSLPTNHIWCSAIYLLSFLPVEGGLNIYPAFLACRNMVLVKHLTSHNTWQVSGFRSLRPDLILSACIGKQIFTRSFSCNLLVPVHEWYCYQRSAVASKHCLTLVWLLKKRPSRILQIGSICLHCAALFSTSAAPTSCGDWIVECDRRGFFSVVHAIWYLPATNNVYLALGHLSFSSSFCFLNDLIMLI